MGRDVPPKGAPFSESVWDGGIFNLIVQILGSGSNIPVWKGVPAYPVVKLPLSRTGVP